MVIEIKGEAPQLTWIKSGIEFGRSEELWAGNIVVASYFKSSMGSDAYQGIFNLPGVLLKDDWLRAENSDELKAKLEKLVKGWFEVASRPMKGDGYWWLGYDTTEDKNNGN